MSETNNLKCKYCGKDLPKIAFDHSFCSLDHHIDFMVDKKIAKHVEEKHV